MEGPVAATVNGNGLLHEPEPTAIDPQHLVKYLKGVLLVTLDASEQDLHATDSLLSASREAETLQRCSLFAQEAQASALYFQKIQAPRIEAVEDEDGVNETSGMASPL
jgi:dynein heavy chain 1